MVLWGGVSFDGGLFARICLRGRSSLRGSHVAALDNDLAELTSDAAVVESRRDQALDRVSMDVMFFFFQVACFSHSTHC